jgi:hypothetical protein
LKPINEISNFYLGEINKKEEVKKIIGSARNMTDLINVRLVIDFFKADEDKETYICDGDWLYSSDGGRARKIGEEFKKNFSSFWRKQ